MTGIKQWASSGNMLCLLTKGIKSVRRQTVWLSRLIGKAWYQSDTSNVKISSCAACHTSTMYDVNNPDWVLSLKLVMGTFQDTVSAKR